MLKLEQIQATINENSHVVKNSGEIIQIIKAAACAGICPECGARLVLTNVRWHLFGPRGRDARVECPNGHNIDYNARTGTKPECFGYDDMDLHRIGNGLWANTQNDEIRTLAFRIGSWLGG